MKFQGFMNKLFYFFLFFTFCLPNNTWLTIGLGSLSIREIGLILLPIINSYCSSQFRTNPAVPGIKRLIIGIILIIFTTEYIKSVFVDNNLFNFIKSVRIALPVLSILIIVYSGFKADFNKIIRVFFIAIIFSILLSLISYVFNFQFWLTNQSLINDASAVDLPSGRMANDNSAFGIIGLLILFKFKDKNHPHYFLIRVGSILSVIVLILAFNRTYLIVLLLEIIYLSFVSFNLMKFLKIIGFISLVSILLYILYLNVEVVKNQIDDRIIRPYIGDVTIKQSVIDNNRDVIYKEITDRISEGYWLFGLPFSKPIWIWDYGKVYQPVAKSITDISFINLLLRFGIGVVFTYVTLLFSYYKSLKQYKYLKNIFIVAMPLYLLASLNIDALMFHNSVFFVFLFSYLSFNKQGYLFFNNLGGKLSRLS